jgi:hypothetical protein
MAKKCIECDAKLPITWWLSRKEVCGECSTAQATGQQQAIAIYEAELAEHRWKTRNSPHTNDSLGIAWAAFEEAAQLEAHFDMAQEAALDATEVRLAEVKAAVLRANGNENPEVERGMSSVNALFKHASLAGLVAEEARFRAEALEEEYVRVAVSTGEAETKTRNRIEAARALAVVRAEAMAEMAAAELKGEEAVAELKAKREAEKVAIQAELEELGRGFGSQTPANGTSEAEAIRAQWTSWPAARMTSSEAARIVDAFFDTLGESQTKGSGTLFSPLSKLPTRCVRTVLEALIVNFEQQSPRHTQPTEFLEVIESGVGLLAWFVPDGYLDSAPLQFRNGEDDWNRHSRQAAFASFDSAVADTIAQVQLDLVTTEWNRRIKEMQGTKDER